jgi:mono/diheme cytochrome c family protein
MKQTIGFTLSVLVAVALLAVFYSGPAASGAMAAAAAPANLDGKQIFLAQKCNLCHSIPTAGIERTVKSEKMAGPDLVNVKEDAGTLTKFLKKQAEINGKKHSKTFTGTDEELGALIAWIQAQKK